VILVTGGAGYIGSHYVLHERARGAEVLVVDSLARGHQKAVLDAPLAVGDLTDRGFLERVFRGHRIEAVVHFAAFAYVGESVARPGAYYGNNVVGTLALLEAMRDHSVSTCVFSSSCATYGDPDYTPIDERHPQRPINPYGDSKLIGERMLGAFARAHGLRFVALRYFNAAGADPEGRIGECHDPETHLIPLALQVAAGCRRELTIFGCDYDTPDGTCIRDYVHVQDLVAAHGLALDRLRDGGPSTCVNLGTEHGHSVRQVIDACARVTGRSIPVVEGAPREGDPARLVASAARARAELGWMPRHAELEEIIATGWRWQQSPRY
jgi:UDP-glucose-4-epimerase GalE